MRITKIEIKNFRAFRGVYQIDLAKAGKNLLIYGENGSGKSSLYLALKWFLESSEDDSIKFENYQNIFTIDDAGYIKLHLRAAPGSNEHVYEWSRDVKETAEVPMINASKSKGFLDYKALLHTHYLHYEYDTVNVFDLLIENLLANVINDTTGQSLAEEWQNISEQVPLAPTHDIETLEAQIGTFNIGVTNQLMELQTKASEILRKFGGEGTLVTLDFDFQGMEYDSENQMLDYQEILLKIKFFDEDIPVHHRFLNEAKLSAIGLAIYFAGFQLQPDSDLKILALDDVLIGLDMSNRVPVLDILDEYFSDYQIFLTTYDKAWYEIVKQRTEQKDWKYVEFYFGQTDAYEIPVYAENKAYLDKAREYLDTNDYKACAVYARTAFEAAIKQYCEKKDLTIKYRENPRDLRSEDFWVPIKMEKDEDGSLLLDLRIVDEIERARKFILNELSHATFVNIYRKELEDAIDAVEQLKNALANERRN